MPPTSARPAGAAPESEPNLGSILLLKVVAEPAAAAAVAPASADTANDVATREEEQAVSTLKLAPFRPKW